MTAIDSKFPTLDTKSDWVEVLTGIITTTCLNHSITHNYATNTLANKESLLTMRMRTPAPTCATVNPTTVRPSTRLIDRMQHNMFLNTPFVTQTSYATIVSDLTYPVTNTVVQQANMRLVAAIVALNTIYQNKFPVWHLLPNISN